MKKYSMPELDIRMYRKSFYITTSESGNGEDLFGGDDGEITPIGGGE